MNVIANLISIRSQITRNQRRAICLCQDFPHEGRRSIAIASPFAQLLLSSVLRNAHALAHLRPRFCIFRPALRAALLAALFAVRRLAHSLAPPSISSPFPVNFDLRPSPQHQDGAAQVASIVWLSRHQARSSHAPHPDCACSRPPPSSLLPALLLALLPALPSPAIPSTAHPLRCLAPIRLLLPLPAVLSPVVPYSPPSSVLLRLYHLSTNSVTITRDGGESVRSACVRNDCPHPVSLAITSLRHVLTKPPKFADEDTAADGRQ